MHAVSPVKRVAARWMLGVLAALCAALALAGPASASRSDCATVNPLCLDALPADSAWEAAIGLPSVANRYQGDGLAVASIDTGVVPGPDFGARLLARVDLTGERDGIDRFGHGTHMAGLIASDGTTSAERFEGSAPETNLVSVKVAGWDGATDVSTVIAALHWVVANRDRYGIRVVNLSWGTDAVRGSGDDPLDRAVEQAWAAGLVVVVAAGNTGPAASTITKPADDPYVITVGAADTGAAATTADDAVAAFSSRGPTADGLVKPDVLAPGVSLVSDRAEGSTIDTFRPLARVGTTLFKGSGTSQAAAIISGVAARMVEANPAMLPDDVKDALVRTATPLAGSDGAGLVNAAAAITAVTPTKARPVLPPATVNAGATPSTGLGTIDGSRGTHPVYRDLDGDGVADLVGGEIDVLGRPWDAAAFAATPWTAQTWADSPWSALTTVTPGSDPVAPLGAGAAAPIVAWEPTYWGAMSWTEAGWDGKYWGGKYWGGKYWGTGSWQ